LQTDNHNFSASFEKELANVKERPNIWQLLQENSRVKCQSEAIVVPFLDEALDLVKIWGHNARQVQVLVTGSLHLVGGVINIINPNIWSDVSSDELAAKKSEMIKLYDRLELDTIKTHNGFHQQS